jgi:peptide/nickel transport system permease protein
MAVALFGLSIFIFVIARVLPGDPARFALGPRASELQIGMLREQLHLNDPIYLQYFYWIRDAFSGNLGQSLVTFRNVSTDIIQFFPATLELVIFAAMIDIVLAISLGVLAGRHANTWIDNLVRGISYIGVAVPSFVFAIVLLLIFGYYGNILPTAGRLSTSMPIPNSVTGMVTIDALLAGRFDIFVNALGHLIMPGLALAAGCVAQEARILRSGVVENLKKDYIVSAVSHGIPERTILFKYLLKPSLIPTVSIMTLDIAALIGNAFLVETIFNWPGFARYGTNAILNKDLNAIVAVVMVTGFIFAISSIIVDIIVSYLDPRIRMIKRAE